MKNSIHTLAVAALLAAFTTTAHAATTQIVTQGRAGYGVAPKNEPQYGYSSKGGHTTTVALAMEKPQQGPTRIQTSGRAGYVAVPNTMNR